MLNKKTLLFAPILLATAINANAADANLPQSLVKNDNISAATMSPDGQYVAYVAPVDNTDVLVIAKANDLTPTFVSQMGANRFVGQISWANDERLMLWPAKLDDEGKTKYYTGRVQAMNYDGSQNVKLWGYAKGHHNVRLGNFSLENRLLSDPKHVMVSTTDTRSSHLETRTLKRINIYNGRIKDIERSTVPQADFVVSNAGDAVIQLGQDEQSNTVVAYKDKAQQWQPLPGEGQYENAWVVDEEHVVLQPKSTERLVKFNRYTMEFSELDPAKANTFIQNQKKQQFVAMARNVEEPDGYYSLVHIRSYRQDHGFRVSQNKIAQADKTVHKSNN